MSNTRKATLPEVLRRLLDGYRRRWRALGSARSVLATLGVLGVSIGAAVAADRVLRLSAGIAEAVGVGRTLAGHETPPFPPVMKSSRAAPVT